MIITISGLPGAGKTTVAKMLAADKGWEFFSMGGLRRQKALEKGMTLAEYNKLGETDAATDLEVDRYQEDLGKTKDNFVIEGRTSWHFIPQAVKIFLTVEPTIGAQRIWQHLAGANNNRNEDDDLKTVDDVLASNQARMASDRLRYEKYFQIDVYDEVNYDLVVDTSELPPEQVLAKIKDFIAKQA